MHFTDHREKKTLAIVEFYLQSIFKTSAPTPTLHTVSPTDTQMLSGEVERILGNDRDPLLQHLSLTAAIYVHIYRKLKADTQLCQEVSPHLPLAPIGIEALSEEMTGSYYPRNKIAQLHFCEKLPSSKIAARLGINVNTVKYHLRYFNKKYPKNPKV